jgi:hypothetical protein
VLQQHYTEGSAEQKAAARTKIFRFSSGVLNEKKARPEQGPKRAFWEGKL